ncbi:uncharacterized protein LOC131005951 [Salvia miltiorrhiza]|uniref:uncharacterized protein LOC131005951 n=1 Tax=Salvia miltiorrhiza TaxID=226208 RepID=UPI0025AD2538|nr:uncharacterized protein LOC131005951 [Salvia miltiorrhiza]
MAGTAEGAGFWLPSEFLDDFLVDKENLNLTESDSEFRFPNEFPYDFGTKSDELLEFSQKRWVMSTSPQSTLSRMSSWTGRSAGGSTNGSPNGFPSPPTTPKNDAVGDLIYLAAGQVAKLKLAAGPTKHKGLVGPPRAPDHLYPAAKTPDPSLVHSIYLQQQMAKQQKQGCEMWPQMYQMRTGQDAWPVQPNPARVPGPGGRAAVYGGGGGAAVKRGCAGTGVFLPRRYGNNNNININNNNIIINNNNGCNAYASDSRKKPAGYSAASIPNRNVHALNKNFDTMNGFAQSQPHYQPKFIPEYDLLVARRNALVLQHRLLEGSSPMNRGAYLPQEWTY